MPLFLALRLPPRPGRASERSYYLPLVNLQHRYTTSVSSLRKGVNGKLYCTAKQPARHWLKRMCEIKLVSASFRVDDEYVRSLRSLDIDIIISTPLRLLSALQQGSIELGKYVNQLLIRTRILFDFDPPFSVRHLILDEADRLLEQGFLPQIEEIIGSCTYPNVQKAVFSATLPAGIESIAKGFLQDPIRVVVGLKFVFPFPRTIKNLHTNPPSLLQRLGFIPDPPNANICRYRIRQTLNPPTAPRQLPTAPSPHLRPVPRTRRRAASRTHLRQPRSGRPTRRHDSQTAGRERT